MTPEQAAERAAELLPTARTSVLFGRATVEVAREEWAAAAAALRDDARLAASCFDLLTAVDHRDEGFEVVLHLWSLAARTSVLLSTRCPRDDAWVPSLADVFAGADWHERETAEMFGLAFEGHPGLAPLLLPPGFVGTPLRKDFVLASRVAKPWPGLEDAGETQPARGRRRVQPPGVPRPGTWTTGDPA
ncbi:MAG: NADH-quinone oxidoreductase subunit C [Actinomycetota bacterium]|nr:NADH-quinone oxidoreductase subunit C [Actinomycetota bacterium]